MMKLDALNFTIYDVEENQKSLMVEFANNDSLEIDMASVEKIDIAAMQLLVSAKRSCQEAGKPFVLKNVCDEVTSAIRTCGLESELGV
jgi:anti-anti-sigma regulatory factor